MVGYALIVAAVLATSSAWGGSPRAHATRTLPSWEEATAPRMASQRSVLHIVRRPFDLVGLELGASADGVRVVRVRPGSPAWVAGVSAGSLVLQVDGRDVRHLDLELVVRNIRAAPRPVQIGLLQGDEVVGYELDKQSSWSCYRVWSDTAVPGVVREVRGVRVEIECPSWSLPWVADALIPSP